MEVAREGTDAAGGFLLLDSRGAPAMKRILLIETNFIAGHLEQ
jgi:hypothetical protein